MLLALPWHQGRYSGLSMTGWENIILEHTQKLTQEEGNTAIMHGNGNIKEKEQFKRSKSYGDFCITMNESLKPAPNTIYDIARQIWTL